MTSRGRRMMTMHMTKRLEKEISKYMTLMEQCEGFDKDANQTRADALMLMRVSIKNLKDLAEYENLLFHNSRKNG
jgi:hypothetical protein